MVTDQDLHLQKHQRRRIEELSKEAKDGVLMLRGVVFYPSPFLPLCMECNEKFELTPMNAEALPTESCIVTWLHKEGFRHIFFSHDINQERLDLKWFVATNNEDAYKLLKEHTGEDAELYEVTDLYWELIHQTLAASLVPITE